MTPFAIPDPATYPPGNRPAFEEWFMENYVPTEGHRTYIPVLWTSYQRRANYGKNKAMMYQLQEYVNHLDRDKKYFAVVQYDDGILVNLDHLDVKVFAMSGKRIDYPLPLICQPYRVIEAEKKYFLSFVGKNTHPIRETILKSPLLKGEDCYVTDGHHEPEKYHTILAQSVFALCPRGYGQTSFRIMEAVRQGAIPVYVSDEHIIPHGDDFTEYGVLIDGVDADSLYDILSGIHQTDIDLRQLKSSVTFDALYSFEANLYHVIQNVT